MAKYRTAQGKELDIQAMMLTNEKTIAVGNARMNARGDLLGNGGKIVKTREELAAEYYENDPKAVTKVSLKNNLDEQIPAKTVEDVPVTPEVAEEIKAADSEFETAPAKPKKK